MYYADFFLKRNILKKIFIKINELNGVVDIPVVCWNKMVGLVGYAPTTSPMSREHSTIELKAHEKKIL